MRKLAAVILAVFLIGLVAFTRGSEVTVNCGPTVSDPITMVGIRKAQTFGDRVARLQHGSNPVAIYRAVRGMFDTVGLWIDSFVRSAKGQPESKLAKWWGSDIETQRAAAIASCTTDGNADPNEGGGLDCGLGAAAAVTGRQLAITVASRYWTDAKDLRIAVAIAGAESGYNPRATHRNSNGSTDYGLWQINTVHADLLSRRDWSVAADNAWMAYQVWLRAGRSWTPWSTYNSGSFRSFLGNAPSTPLQDCGPVDEVRNFRGNKTVAEAVGWMSTMAANKTPISAGMCLHWVGVAYGHNTTQSWTAIGQWQIIPAQYKHQGTPPRGALVFWNTDRPGQARPGHIALSLGGGRVLSTDYPRAGIIGVANIKAIDTWGTRVGWTDPWFPGQTS